MEQIGRPSKRKPKPRPVVNTIGDALAFEDPVATLWPNLVEVVFGSLSFPNILFALIGFVLALSISSAAKASETTGAAVQVNQTDIRTQLDNVSHKIEMAGQCGVGIKSYQDALSGIEAEYKAGVKADTLQQRLTSLSRALDEQSARAKQLKIQRLRQSASAAVKDDDENDQYDYGPFITELQRRIRKAWHPPGQGEGYHLKALFAIDKNGDFADIRIDNPHALDSVNKAAIEAIEYAAPFRIPNPNRKKPINIEFTFDYNVH